MCCYQPDAVHGAGLEVHQHGAGHVLAAARLVVVHVDALQLQLGLASVGAGGVDTVLVTTRELKVITIDFNNFQIPCLIISQNLAPIWLPHWPACTCTISLMVMDELLGV